MSSSSAKKEAEVAVKNKQEPLPSDEKDVDDLVSGLSKLAVQYTKEYADCVVLDGSSVTGVLVLGGVDYDLIFEEVEIKHSEKSPDWTIFYLTSKGRKAKTGSAWEKTGKNCGHYFWIIFTLYNKQHKFNAFRKKGTKGSGKPVLYELVSAPNW